MQPSDNQSGEFDATYTDVEIGDASIARREKKVRGEFWKKFRRVAGFIPFADDLVAAYYCAMDPNTPVRVRGVLLGALAYFILPIDAVPDFIAGFGFSDDAAVLAAAISMVSRHMKEEHRIAAAKALGKATPPGNDTTAV